jgi:hypothetical protein
MTPRMRRIAFYSMLAPHHAGPEAISAWLAAGGGRRAPLAEPIDIDRLRRVPALLDEVLASPVREAPATTRRFRRTAAEPPSSRRSLSR